ncbi:MAG: class I SAM-dependent methyltransferase [Gammaproteobacteria bacterium]|nr:class I SAM-dependent methyltransferase [Gammaproteobacteria bacterium]
MLMEKSQQHVLISADSFSGQASEKETKDSYTVNGAVNEFDRWLSRKLLAAIGYPNIAFQLWNGEKVELDKESSIATICIKNRNSLFKLIIDPLYYFGDLYSIGAVDVVGDLHACLDSVYSSINKSRNYFFLDIFNKYRRHANNFINARKNIHHHYDIGDVFYKQWLDSETMQYTCAYFEEPTMSLEQAQIAKMHHICRKLDLKPGQSVVEAGCGWGGLARFMAQEYGVKVKAYNISHKQISYAHEQISNSDLSDQVEYIEDDYRNITGNYDVFVSVGMLEHIGIEYYHCLGNVIDNCLNDIGRGLIHSIGRNEPGLLNAWIEARIFPGACPPSLGQMMQIFEPYSLSILDIENLRLHYAKTLEHWIKRFETRREFIQKMYDKPFVRGWYLYLMGSKAAFTSGTMQLFQVLFTRPKNNDLRWSRSHLYLKQ